MRHCFKRSAILCLFLDWHIDELLLNVCKKQTHEIAQLCVQLVYSRIQFVNVLGSSVDRSRESRSPFWLFGDSLFICKPVLTQIVKTKTTKERERNL